MGFWTKIPQVITGVKALSKTGAKPVEKWKLQAAKAKKEAAKFNLEQTFKKTDKELEKLKMAKDALEQTFKKTDESLKKFGKTVKKQKKILED